MKCLLPAMFCLGISGMALGQNQIIAPSGQPVRIAADTVVVGGSLKVANTLVLSTYRFIAIRKTAAGDLNTMVGANSGNLTMTGRWNTFLGENAGTANTTGGTNTFLGNYSGMANTTGSGSTNVGYKAGTATTTGKYNVMVGNTTGALNISGESNVFMGVDAGWSNQTGNFNTYLGRNACVWNVSGVNNTAIGTGAGYRNLGSDNVFIGRYAGFNDETGSNRLYIANHNTNLPLVYGEFPPSPTAGGKFVINGQVGVGVTNFPASAIKDSTGLSVPTSSFQLFVNGSMLAKEFRVNATWADYVFENGYPLEPLSEVEDFIHKNGHLEGMPSAKTVAMSGLDLGETARVQQEKIEELTLYLIAQKKRLEAQQQKILTQMIQLEKASAILEKQ